MQRGGIEFTERKVKCIVLCYIGSKSVKTAINEPLGIETVAGAIRYYRPEVNVILYNEQVHGTNKLLDMINDDQPDIIGFSVPNGSLETFIGIKNKLKKLEFIDKEPIILCGGTIPTFYPEVILKSSPESFVIKGEGDESILQFIDAVSGKIDISKVTNLMYKCNNQTIQNIRSKPDINNIMLPSRDLVKEAVELGGYAFIETSRGCSWGCCTFCLRHENEEHKRFPASKVIEDVKMLDSLGIKKVYFTDEEFIGNDLDWLEEFCEELLKLDLKIEFMATCQAVSIYKANSKDNKRKSNILKKLKQAGLTKLYLGIESGSATQLKRYGKSATLEENIQAIKILKELNFVLGVGFINFDTFISLNELGENIKFIEENDILHNIFSPFHSIDVREGSGYEKILKRNNMLGKLNKDTTCYEYKFKYEIIETIYKNCNKLLNNWLEFQIVLRQMSNTSNIKIAKECYKYMRDFQFQALKAMYEMAAKNQLDELKLCKIDEDYNVKVRNLYQQLLESISEDNEYLREQLIKSLPEEKINLIYNYN